ncbi:MAG: DEAD/DEAH box helicase [Alphaproteobacteria bacterium]|jgi:superfamily II DNA/RNA helicase|nr:DEAD/DEAH box helicase [Alphaproteobacteria bacterium]
MSFDELGLSDDVLKAVTDAGYTEPTPIQAQAIPHVLQGRDVLGCAQTGTGKTASFTLPMIDRLSAGRARARMPRTLILEPTRELAAQVSENFETYGKYHKLSMALLIGGVSFEDQMRKIDRGVDVLIATPGRLLDHTERGRLLLRGVEVLVIDEADRMLDMGFIPDVERIVQLVNPNRQTLFFSATMPPEIRRLADMFLTEPEEIAVAPPASPAELVEQSLSVVHEDAKRPALRALLRAQPVKNALIFCNRKRDVDVVHKSLVKHGFDAAALHGDMTQSYRTQTLDRFRAGEVSLLVCSDVAARGLDIAGLSHVFLFDVPYHAEDYVHRIGRTGRAGMRGRSFTLATPGDTKFLAAVEGLIGREIPRFEIDDVETAGLDEAEGRDRRRRGGGRKRSEGGNGKSKRPRRERGRDKAADGREKKAERAERPVAERSATERKERPPAERKERPAAERKERKSGGRKREEPVLGLGDHVPAFLQRPVRRG